MGTSLYGKTDTWKVVYVPKPMEGGRVGVALVEAANRSLAMQTFMQEYSGLYYTVDSCTKLLG